MNERSMPLSLSRLPPLGGLVPGNWARSLVIARLGRLAHGRLVILDRRTTLSFGRETELCPLQATVRVRDARFYRSLLGGSVGAGESYARGEWECDDLTSLVRIVIFNFGRLEGLHARLFKKLSLPRRLIHILRRNTLKGSRRNIAAHYDLGNEFYSLFLDESMMYSGAIFESGSTSLEEASFAKREKICRKLELEPDDHLVEIGGGWGGFAIHAASRFGCRVTSTTISRQQYQESQRRVARAGLQDLIRIVCQDYRELKGQYDKLVSIEMIEGVGAHYFDTYFAKCSELLKPAGSMLLQAITIADQHYEKARNSVDFIKRHIFPGACLPSVASICDSLARVTDLRLFHHQDITPHYARTLRSWRERFLANLEAVKKQGFGEEFIRLWEFYLCYCEGGFAERYISNVQMLLTKPHYGRRVHS